MAFLPKITMSLWYLFFSLLISARTLPRITVVLFHSGFSRVEETTYFGNVFNLSANSPLNFGQKGAKPS